MSRFWEATWSLKTGHQVVHLAVGRKLVVAIRMRHVRRIFGKSMYSVLEDSRPLVRVLVQEVLWQTGGGAFWECCREIFWGWLLLLEGRFFFRGVSRLVTQRELERGARRVTEKT